MTIGQNRNLVSLEAPATTAMNADGSYTQTWAALDPSTWYCSFGPATVAAQERIGAGTTFSQATHILSGEHHPGITTQTRVVFEGRQLNVLFAGNPEQRNIRSDLICAEVVE